MLSRDVIEAVEAGNFHVHAISSVEEGIEILTGVPAGEADADGDYSEGTVFRAVEDKLEEYYDALRGEGAREDWKPVPQIGVQPPPQSPPVPPGLPPRPGDPTGSGGGTE
jgi:hypothetical protein